MLFNVVDLGVPQAFSRYSQERKIWKVLQRKRWIASLAEAPDICDNVVDFAARKTHVWHFGMGIAQKGL